MLQISTDGEIWIATDDNTGVTTQGDTREHALEMLDDAVEAYSAPDVSLPTRSFGNSVSIPRRTRAGRMSSSIPGIRQYREWATVL